MAEVSCLDLVKGTNRPYNVQGVADMLASKGFKKTQVDKALAALADKGQITCKEFGKTKLYIPCQEDLPTMTTEEANEVMSEISRLTESCKGEERAVAQLRKEVNGLDATLSLGELEARLCEERADLEAAELKLAKLQAEGAVLVSTEDIEGAETRFSGALSVWDRYRRSFRDVWDLVSQNLEANQADIFEEIGIETDEAAGESLKDYQRLLPAKKARR